MCGRILYRQMAHLEKQKGIRHSQVDVLETTFDVSMLLWRLIRSIPFSRSFIAKNRDCRL